MILPIRNYVWKFIGYAFDLSICFSKKNCTVLLNVYCARKPFLSLELLDSWKCDKLMVHRSVLFFCERREIWIYVVHGRLSSMMIIFVLAWAYSERYTCFYHHWFSQHWTWFLKEPILLLDFLWAHLSIRSFFWIGLFDWLNSKFI